MLEFKNARTGSSIIYNNAHDIDLITRNLREFNNNRGVGKDYEMFYNNKYNHNISVSLNPNIQQLVGTFEVDFAELKNVISMVESIMSNRSIIRDPRFGENREKCIRTIVENIIAVANQRYYDNNASVAALTDSVESSSELVIHTTSGHTEVYRMNDNMLRAITQNLYFLISSYTKSYDKTAIFKINHNDILCGEFTLDILYVGAFKSFLVYNGNPYREYASSTKGQNKTAIQIIKESGIYDAFVSTQPKVNGDGIITETTLDVEYLKKFDSIESELIKVNSSFVSIEIPDECQSWSLDILNATNRCKCLAERIKTIKNYKSDLKYLRNLYDSLEHLETNCIRGIKNFRKLKSLTILVNNNGSSKEVDFSELASIGSGSILEKLVIGDGITSDMIPFDANSSIAASLKNLKSIQFGDSYDGDVSGLSNMVHLKELVFEKEFRSSMKQKQFNSIVSKLSCLEKLWLGSRHNFFEKLNKNKYKSNTIKSIRCGSIDLMEKDTFPNLEEIIVDCTISTSELACITEFCPRLRRLHINRHFVNVMTYAKPNKDTKYNTANANDADVLVPLLELRDLSISEMTEDYDIVPWISCMSILEKLRVPARAIPRAANMRQCLEDGLLPNLKIIDHAFTDEEKNILELDKIKKHQMTNH